MQIGITTVTRNWQLTLPRNIRENAGIDQGTKLVIVKDDLGIRILTPDSLDDILRTGARIARKEKITRKELEKRMDDARKITYAEYKKR